MKDYGIRAMPKEVGKIDNTQDIFAKNPEDTRYSPTDHMLLGSRVKTSFLSCAYSSTSAAQKYMIGNERAENNDGKNVGL